MAKRKPLPPPADETKRAEQFRNAVFQSTRDTLVFVAELDQWIKENALSMEPDLVDIGRLVDEAATFYDECRKELNSRLESIERIICLRYLKAVQSGDCTETSVYGNLASGTPDLKQQPMIPKRGTPEYQAMMELLGVPRAIWDVPDPAISLSWNGLREQITKLIAEGKTIPTDVGQMKPAFSVTFRRRQNAVKPEKPESTQEEF